MSVKLYSNVNVLEVGDADLTDFADGYTLYDARYVKKSGDTMTGALFVDMGSDVVGLRVQGHASRTAHLQDWEDSDALVRSFVDKTGGLRIGAWDGNQTVKIGVTSANTYVFEVAHSDLPGLEVFHVESVKYVSTNDGGQQQYGANFVFGVSASSSGHTGGMTGFSAQVRSFDSGLVEGATGASYLVRNTGGGTIYDAIGLAGRINNSSGTIQRAYLFYGGYLLNSGTLNDAYGLYLPDITAGDTKNYAIYTQRGDVSLMSSTSDKFGVYGATPVAQQTVTGSRGGNAALASLLTKLANYGWIVDSST